MKPTDIERAAMLALGHVRYLPASFNKRFGRDMATLAENPEAEVTPRQIWLSDLHDYLRVK